MTTPGEPRNCPLHAIPNQNALIRNRLVLLDLHCANVTVSSHSCLPRESYVKYTCDNGFVFENNRGKQIINISVC